MLNVKSSLELVGNLKEFRELFIGVVAIMFVVGGIPRNPGALYIGEEIGGTT